MPSIVTDPGLADVLCYGTISMDNIVRVPALPSPAQDTHATADEYYTGGEASNVALHLAAWGLRIVLAGNQLGNDEYGRFVWDRLYSQPNLDLRYLSLVPGARSPFCRILVTPDGERTIIGFRFDRLPLVQLTPEMVAEARVLSTDSYGRPGGADAARIARQVGRPVLAADVLSPGHEMLPLCDVVVNSAAALRHRFPEVDLLEHTRRLRQDTDAVIITTDGPRPVLALDRQGRTWKAQPLHVPVVDATGAGDAFRAGYVYSWLAGHDLPDRLRFACASGVLKVGRPGAAHLPPSVSEIETLAVTIPIDLL